MLSIKKLRNNQSGLTTFVVVMIIMILLTLITVAFIRTVGRESRQVVDRQLSTQAFYAAESGINKAIEELNTSGTVAPRTTCGAPTQVGSDPNVSYSCLLVDPDPTSVLVSSVKDTDSFRTPMSVKSGATFDKITIKWKSVSSGNNFACPNMATSGTPPAASAWGCDVGLLRVDLSPAQKTPVTNDFHRDDLNNNTSTYYFFAQDNNASSATTLAAADGASRGLSVRGSCDDSASGGPWCTVVIDTTGALNRNRYFVRVQSLYRDSSIDITAGDGTVEIAEAQAQVDSTGKSNDVLRRMQVRLSLASNIGTEFAAPDYAIGTIQSICKVLNVPASGSPTIPGGPAGHCDTL